MKEVLTKIKSSKALGQIVVGFFCLIALEYAIYPLLTAASTIRNIFGGVAGILLAVILFYYLKVDDVFLKIEEKQNPKQFDGVKSDEPFVNPKNKKPNSKQFDGVKSDEPFVKTRKKSVTKKTK
jgi:hypothetical protein